MRSLRRLTFLALSGVLALGNGLLTPDVRAAEALSARILVNPLSALVSLSTVQVEEGEGFQAFGTVANAGAGALLDVGLELRGDGSLLIDGPTRFAATLAGHGVHEEAWAVCATQPGLFVLLLAADATGAEETFTVESQAVLVEVLPSDRVCGGFIFDGFFNPVENPPILNVTRAGSSIPVKFSLGGDQGLEIFAVGYPASIPIACDSAAPTDAVEQIVAAGASGLSYSAATDTYTYVWKTKKPWAGTCRQLLIGLTDGSVHRANFKFTH